MNPEFGKNIIGLDISDRAWRFVQLKRAGKKIVLTAYREIEVPAGLLNNP